MKSNLILQKFKIIILLVLLSLNLLVYAGTSLEFSQPIFPDSEFIDLISRESESFSVPTSFGHKFITGGAGEGVQQLRPEDNFERREHIKSDKMLPAYCEPPNPCPVGFTASDGCLDEFENSAEFSRNYQAQQQCLCDQEHMFNCASKNTEKYEESLEEMLSKNGLHKSMIAKKFHTTRAEEPRRRKRSENNFSKNFQIHNARFNPYLADERLHAIIKKDGRNI